jgi:hypothetical protein
MEITLTEQQRRILLIIGFVLITLLMVFLVWWFFFTPLVETPVTNVNLNVNGGQLPTTNVSTGPGVITNEEPGEVRLPEIQDRATGGLTLTMPLVDSIVKDARRIGDELRYYQPETGKFYKVLSDGTIVELSSKVFRGVEEVIWSPRRNEAILNFPDGQNILYNFDEGAQYNLPKELEEIRFSGSGEKIGFKFMGAGRENQWLGVSSPQGSDVKVIDLLGDNADRLDVNWSPSDEVVATLEVPLSGDRQELQFVGQNQENLFSTIIEGFGLDSQWSPNGRELLYSVYRTQDDYRPRLWMVDAQGEEIGKNRRDLGLFTWASKCAFSSQSGVLFCGVPKNLQEGAGILPHLVETNDTLFRIDLNRGTREEIALPVTANRNDDFDVERLFVSPNEDQLWFTNATDGKIYEVQL